MTLSRFAKSLLYTGAAAVLTVLSVYYQRMLHQKGGPAEGYFAIHRVLFFVSVVLMGIAVYSFLSYTRKQKRHRADSLMLLVTGVSLMAVTIALWIGFGGVQEPFDATGYMAVNIQITTLTVLPVPFWIRGLVLACTTHEDNKGKRLAAKLASLAVALLMAVLVAVGGMMRMMYYDETNAIEDDALNGGRPSISQMKKGAKNNV